MTKTVKPLVISTDTPAKSADKFLKTRPNLIYQQGEWLDYKAGAYSPVENDTILSEIFIFAEGAKKMVIDEASGKKGLAPFNPKPRDVNAIREILQHKVQKAGDTMAPPCWLDGRDGPDPKLMVSCQNGLLNIETRELIEPTPAFFTRTALPINYTPDAPPPALWLTFLFEVGAQRPHLVRAIQEMMGYMISSDTSQHRVFFLFGEPRSGKGTILRVLGALMGIVNVAYSTIETLGGRFGYQGLIGKSGLFITDMNSSNTQHIGLAASRINAISGEDNVQAERKNREDWVGRIGARTVMAANGLPRFGVHTEALMTRLLITPFEVSFEGREDRQLTSKLLTELPGILNWCLDGLDVLRMTGEFEETEESKQMKRRLENVSEPLFDFIELHCELGPDFEVDKDVLYSEYRDYAIESGQQVMQKNTFSERLRTLRKGIGSARPRDGEKRANVFTGIHVVRSVSEKIAQTEFASRMNTIGEI